MKSLLMKSIKMGKAVVKLLTCFLFKHQSSIFKVMMKTLKIELRHHLTHKNSNGGYPHYWSCEQYITEICIQWHSILANQMLGPYDKC
ncbi:hypothetical protein X975_04884, partial [Stegodyphus mimosarum]